MPRSIVQLAPHLTPREREVLSLLALQGSAREIAEETYVSVNTVRSHIKNIYVKLGVNRRTDAVRQARALRMIPADQIYVATDPKARRRHRDNTTGTDFLGVDGLDDPTSELLRIGALIAMDAPASSFRYLFDNDEAVVNLERCVAALIAVAPVIGSVRAASAATSVLDAYGCPDRDVAVVSPVAR